MPDYYKVGLENSCKGHRKQECLHSPEEENDKDDGPVEGRELCGAESAAFQDLEVELLEHHSERCHCCIYHNVPLQGKAKTTDCLSSSLLPKSIAI